VVCARALTKRYGTTLALDTLDLTVRRGEVYGFLGPNGAGKTTTIRLLLGLHRPTSGRAELFGLDAFREPVIAHRRIAYVPGEPALWPSLTAAETFELLASLHGGTDVAYRNQLIDRFALDTSRRLRDLSKGNRQKVTLVAALATRAELLLLDEPTAGLDPLMEVAFRESVSEARDRGQTVFLSSHILSEVEALCDRVGILRAGRLIDEGTLSELRHLAAQTVEASFEGGIPDLPPLPGIKAQRTGERSLRFEVAGPIAPLLGALAGSAVISLTSREPSLEEVFLHHYESPEARVSPEGMSALSHSPRIHRRRAVAERSGTHPVTALVRREVAQGRRRTIIFGALFVLIAYIQPVSYRHSYPTLVSRLGFAHSFADNKAIRLFYGVPHNLLSVGGYTAWRVGAIVAVLGAAWAAVSVVGVLRGEEEAGRTEVVLAMPIGRRSVYGAALVALGVQATALAIPFFAGLIAAGLPAGGSAFLAVAACSVIPVFAALGALASQLVGTRRRATELTVAALALAFAIRVVADTVAGAGWLRWLSPLGWVELMRPFSDPRPLVLVLPALVTGLMLVCAARIALARDAGTGLIAAHAARRSRLVGLSSTVAFAVRSELVSLLAWTFGVAAFAVLIGAISSSVSSAGIPQGVRRELARVGASSLASPAGYLGFAFLFFVLAVSLFACSQISAARVEELSGRLGTMFALPVRRARWLADRVLVAAGSVAMLSLAAGVGVWVGARAAGVHVALGELLLAGANCCAVAGLFLGIAALGYALAPRAAGMIAYGLVTLAFLWQLFGSLLGAPRWLIDVSPFVHLGLAPSRPFRLGSVAVMLLIGALAAVASTAVFERRDLRADA